MIWACLRDAEPLTRVDDRLRCSACSAEYRIPHGIPVFSDVARETTRPDGAEPDDVLSGLWSSMQHRSAAAAADRFCEDRGCVRRRHGADWKSVFPVEHGQAILEVGPGFGDDTVELVRTGPTVTVAHDLTAARIVDRRLREASVEGADVVVCPRLERLPLASASIGAAAFEIAALPAFGPSAASFEAFTAELARVVAPGGTVFVGVPNGLDRLPGLARLRTLMQAKSPRPSFRRILQRSRSSRTPGPGASRILRCMRSHGFQGPAVYAPLPHERDVQVVIPVDDARVVRYFLDHLIRRNSLLVRLGINLAHIMLRLGLFERIVPYRYLFFTRGSGPSGAGRTS